MNPQAYNSTPPYESAFAYAGQSAEARNEPPVAIKPVRRGGLPHTGEESGYFGGLPWPQAFFTVVSMFAVAALLVFPIWNSAFILQSAPYVHFVGKENPTWLLLCLIFCWAGYSVLILLFFHSKPKVQTWQSLTMISMAAFTLIGIVCMLFGRDLYDRSLSTSVELERNCLSSSSGTHLKRTSDQLYALRYDDACADELSVEECPGYTSSADSNLLKAIETDFRCSTWCNDPKAPGATTPAGKSYPRTLFSTSSYRASCQMAIVRNLRTQLEEIALQTYWMGCMFVATAVFTGVVKLMGFCLPKSLDSMEPKMGEPLAQGTQEARDYGAAPRYVRDGIVF